MKRFVDWKAFAIGAVVVCLAAWALHALSGFNVAACLAIAAGALVVAAEHYAIDRALVAAAERLAAEGKLRLTHHFHVTAPDGRTLCESLDDFAIVTLDEDVERRIRDSIRA